MRITTVMDPLAPLLDRTLVLVAHPDDEAVACAALLQRIRAPLVVFATDGAPRDSFFWQQYGSRAEYARLRHEEAHHALLAVGVRRLEWLNGGAFIDQELFRSFPRAYEELLAIARRHQATALLTLAYEGGHPDHDACSALAFAAGRELALPVWEAPLYHAAAGTPARQQFLAAAGTEQSLQLTSAELERKRTMWAAYSSQAITLQDFDPQRELVRMQPAYDYSQPPHLGALNYEAWQWPMKGNEVSAALAAFLHKSCGTAASAVPLHSGAR
jgi:LmbE family N-acetylglucosaminyl deacetylase